MLILDLFIVLLTFENPQLKKNTSPGTASSEAILGVVFVVECWACYKADTCERACFCSLNYLMLYYLVPIYNKLGSKVTLIQFTAQQHGRKIYGFYVTFWCRGWNSSIGR